MSRPIPAEERCHVEVHLVTPEPDALAVFGPGPGHAVAEILRDAGVRLHLDAFADVTAGHRLVLMPGANTLDVDRVVALPRLVGHGFPACRATSTASCRPTSTGACAASPTSTLLGLAGRRAGDRRDGAGGAARRGGDPAVPRAGRDRHRVSAGAGRGGGRRSRRRDGPVSQPAPPCAARPSGGAPRRRSPSASSASPACGRPGARSRA